MRWFQTCVLLILVSAASAQTELNYGVYVQNTFFPGSDDERYTAPDIFENYHTLRRLNLSVRVFEDYEINAWGDFEYPWELRNFEFGIRRWFEDQFFAEIFLRKQTYELRGNTRSHEFSGQEVRQPGLGVGYSKWFGPVRFMASQQISLGLTDTYTTSILRSSDTNFRSMMTHTYQIKDFISSRSKLHLTWRWVQQPRFELGMEFRMVLIADRFELRNTTRNYEWSYQNLTSEQSYNAGQTMLHLINYAGLMLRIRPSGD